MARLFFTIFLMVAASVRMAWAQTDLAWVQVEAHPSLNTTQARIRDYARRLPDVNGFALGGGWYGIALGPYTREDAQRVLQVYRAEGEIPRDSYIARSSDFRQQFWPVGANLLNLPDAASQTPQVAQSSTQQPESAADTVAEATPATPAAPQKPEFRTPDETPREARASEARMTRDERKELQSMLKWAGHYAGAIDGAYGRGTRSSMGQWQDANGYKPTGIMTTGQRAELRKQYNAILEGLGLSTVADTTAGIEMKLPTGVVKFTKYSPPFAHFDATGDIPARVLLISQQGDRNTLHGLYDIMQTLEIVPEEGPRERNNQSFMLIGQGGDFVSHTQASLKNGEIKGFTLIWPAGDEERRTRLLGEMQKSFKRLDGAMSPDEGADEQAIDLLSGLEIRKPKLSRSGFFIDGRGTVVTTAQAVAGCGRITLDHIHEASVLASDEGRGIAILRARETLAPGTVAALRRGVPRLQSDVAVSGFSYEGILGAPTLTFGKLRDVKGLRGEANLKRLALVALPGDAGGPVFDDSGAVMGMLLPALTGSRQLPEEVAFAADADAIRAVLDRAGVTVTDARGNGPIAPEVLTRRAMGMTVLVSCWE
ncbi:MAG: peptidoglycan-binding protein [Rhodobacterales bacterium]|nr:MAG: peptidoglycan-binding protein [Rhodobacterales bacterium]